MIGEKTGITLEETKARIAESHEEPAQTEAVLSSLGMVHIPIRGESTEVSRVQV